MGGVEPWRPARGGDHEARKGREIMAFDPDAYLAQTAPQGGAFDPDAYLKQTAPAVSPIESGLRGMANNFPLAPQAIAFDEAATGIGDEGGYSKNLADWNAKAQAAKAENPKSYGAGAVTGAIAPMFIPVVGAAMKASPVLSNAALGAANAISNTDLAKNPRQALIEAAKGGGIGAAIGKLSTFLPTGESIAKRATSPEAVAAKLAHPGVQAGEPDVMARELPDTFNKMHSAASGVSDYADSLLSSSPYLEEGAIPKDNLVKVIDNARGNFTGMSDEGNAAIKTLNKWADRADKLHNTISQQNVKGFIRNIDKDINWNRIRFDPTYQPTLEEQGLMKIRGTLDDMLKTANPQYGKQMETVSDLLTSAREFAKKFGLLKREGEIVPGDTTANVLNTALKGSKEETQRVLGKAQELTGKDIETPLLLRQFKGPTPENPMGIPSHIGGALVGAAAGNGLGLGGMGLGALAGHRMLREPMSVIGRKMAGALLENPRLLNAANRLPQGIAQALNDFLSSKYGKKQKEPNE